MDARGFSRIRLAAAVAGGSAAAISILVSASGATGGPAALTPDLVMLPIAEEQIFVTREGSKTVLRMTSEVANQANGPLEVFPSAVSLDCDEDGDLANDRDASQRIFEDSNGSGGFEPGVDGTLLERRFGCMRYHAAHNHWHVLDFARYELHRERGGRRVAQSRKVGFCLVDTRPHFASPATPSGPRYPFGASREGVCDQSATQGLSPGWADAYVFALPGQQLDVGGLPRGRYCLASRVDPLDLLAELDEANNTAHVRLALRPRRLSVHTLPGDCRA